jgi:hypothetical protein
MSGSRNNSRKPASKSTAKQTPAPAKDAVKDAPKPEDQPTPAETPETKPEPKPEPKSAPQPGADEDGFGGDAPEPAEKPEDAGDVPADLEATPEAKPEDAAEAGPEPEPINDLPAGDRLEPVLEEAIQAQRAEDLAALAELDAPVQAVPLVGTINDEGRHVVEDAGNRTPQQTEVGSTEAARVPVSADLLANAPLEAVTQLPADDRVTENEKVQDALTPTGPGLVLPDVTAHRFPENLPAPGDEVPVPKSAVLDPPAKAEREELEGIVLPTSADASAERLRVTEREVYITDSEDNPVDPETVFAPAGEGLQECRVRLVEHTTITAHNRPTRTLALAKGRVVSDATAKGFLAKL